MTQPPGPPLMTMPCPLKLWMSSPRTVTLAPWITNPETPDPAWLPSSSTIGLPA